MLLTGQSKYPAKYVKYVNCEGDAEKVEQLVKEYKNKYSQGNYKFCEVEARENPLPAETVTDEESQTPEETFSISIP